MNKIVKNINNKKLCEMLRIAMPLFTLKIYCINYWMEIETIISWSTKCTKRTKHKLQLHIKKLSTLHPWPCDINESLWLKS